MVHDFISNNISPSMDPNWKYSGASSPVEYAKWSPHICGVACLKMAISFYYRATYPLFHILSLAIQYGAYVEKGDDISGMIYYPAVEMLQREFNIYSKVLSPTSLDELHSHIRSPCLFIASVHPWIRQPKTSPPSRGGHLVLITEATSKKVVFHNPSGTSIATQKNVTLDHQDFNRFFAGRGIFLAGPQCPELVQRISRRL